MVRDRHCSLHRRATVPQRPEKTPNVCPHCSAPLRPDKTCIMGQLCDTVANSNYQPPFSSQPRIRERQDAPASSGAPPNDLVTNPGSPPLSFDDKTLPEPPESIDFCRGCGLHLASSCEKCPLCGSSHYPPEALATASARPAPSSSRNAYAAVKQGLGSPRAPQFDDAPEVTWEGPGGSPEDDDHDSK